MTEEQKPPQDENYVIAHRREKLEKLRAAEDFRSPLARAVGSKGYHDRTFAEGPYPVTVASGEYRS